MGNLEENQPRRGNFSIGKKFPTLLLVDKDMMLLEIDE
jgi:hypothetical protein